MAGDESTLAPERRRRAGSMELLLIALTALALSGSWVSGVLTDHARLAAAATVFCGVFVQALPFLVLGVIVSGLVAAYLTPERLARLLPRRPALAVAVAGVGGAALPGCECGSVPVARRLFSGETAGAALTFMLSAPAINPVVLVATAVAFPGQPQMVVARCVASLLTAVVMGLLWQRWGRAEWVTRTLPAHHDEGASRFTVFAEAARHDFLQSAAYLVVGAGAAAVLRAAVPSWVFEQVAGNLVVGVVTMALLAVVLALCSEADAFVAASLTMVPLVPRLVFLVVGPAVDVKLFAMQAGVFGRPFAVRFAPVTLVVATVCATAVGLLLLGGAS
ncbi:permease [Mycobacterium sp. SMC-17]|uniref:permease n=1 Tax=Mycobacterium sp. SMC-17 TaxID=3381628 RepID=UPI003875B8AC